MESLVRLLRGEVGVWRGDFTGADKRAKTAGALSGRPLRSPVSEWRAEDEADRGRREPGRENRRDRYGRERQDKAEGCGRLV